MADNRRRLTLREVMNRIATRVIPEPNSGCYLWLGSIKWSTGAPYGGVMYRGECTGVHRVVWEGNFGPIPDGMHVLHKCDVRLCCNPSHLFLGTNDQNHADKASKDRGRKRLTHIKAVEIHRLCASGVSQHAVARRFGVRQGTVSRIVAGKRRPLALAAASQE